MKAGALSRRPPQFGVHLGLTEWMGWTYPGEAVREGLRRGRDHDIEAVVAADGLRGSEFGGAGPAGRRSAGCPRDSDRPDVIANSEKVKEDFAAALMQDSLRNAFRNANFETPESAAIKAHIVLNEFSSGSTAKRFLVGFGAGRSTVDGQLVIQDADGKELASVPIRVRGNLAWSSYQGGNTQRAQASNSFDRRLMEEIARLK